VSFCSPRHAAATLNRPTGAWMRNLRREFTGRCEGRGERRVDRGPPGKLARAHSERQAPSARLVNGRHPADFQTSDRCAPD
jgi:hypothetical protein